MQISNHKIIMNAKQLRKESTEAEQIFWKAIRRKALGFRFNRQYIIDDKYIVDFLCFEKSLIVEIDGGQHCECNADMVRDSYLHSKGFRVLRFWNNEIIENIEGCLYRLREELDK